MSYNSQKHIQGPVTYKQMNTRDRFHNSDRWN